MFSRGSFVPSSMLLFSAVLLSGCGMGGLTGGTSTLPSAALQGKAMGGQQPVSGSSVQLYAANYTGYGAASIARLTTPATTDANGSFSIPSSSYTCPTPTTQIYLVAKGGNPGITGTVNNAALTLMVALGPCASITDSTHIIMNELTTVAAAWALAPFMKTYDHLGTSAGNATGLTNAFGMAANLADFATGHTPGAAPAGAAIPSVEVNTLANALASCVNTSGGVAGGNNPCGTLFTAATPPGGVAPTNTVDAALNIALHPGVNVQAIYDLNTPTAPFQPTLPAAPNDWTVAITFPIGPTVATNIAIDATGNVWAVAPDGLYELSATGVKQPSYANLAGNTVAFDPSGNIWVALSASSQVAKMPANMSTPTFYNVTTTGSGTGVGGLAIDGSGNVWYTCSTCVTVNELNPDGTAKAQSPSNGGGLITSVLSIDPSENVWVGNLTYSGFYVLKPDATLYPNEPYSCGGGCGRSGFIANDHAGQGWFIGNNMTLVSGPGGTATNIDSPKGGIFNPSAVAIDGAGAAWVANTSSITSLDPNATPTSGSISAFDTTGAPLSSSTGYSSDTLLTPQGIAVDGSGNVWVRNSGAATVTAFLGTATPVVTPFSLGLQNGTLGQKP